MNFSLQSFIKKHRLTTITIFYWLLLAYVVVALIWWFIALERQNQAMFEQRVSMLSTADTQYTAALETLQMEKKRKTHQYTGEGITFLIFILVGAVFVYRSVKNQIQLSKQQQNFMMAVTHELKTPIAVVNLNLETIQKRKLEASQQQKLIAHTLQEVNRLNTLTSNILVTAQLESGHYTADKELINFSELISDNWQQFMHRFSYRQIEGHIEHKIEIIGEKLLLQLLLSNLVENALKYSDSEAKIFIELYSNNKKIILRVIDEGIGVLPSEKKRIFKKFYRTGNEVTRNTQGTGLGLYLCKRIVKDHKGTITVQDNHPKGSIFTVTLNAA